MVGERRPSVRARLAKAGLEPDHALNALRLAGLADDEGHLDDVVVAAVSEAASPSDALMCITELAIQQPAVYKVVRDEPAWLARVVAVAGVSRPLGDLIAQYADAVDSLRTLDAVDVVATADAVAQAVSDTDDPAQQAAGIAAIRRRATADIAARDLTGIAGMPEVASELSRLAEAVLDGTLRGVQALLDDTPKARIAVIGMGKLGGRELNYVSDVDVVYVHEPLEGVDDAAAAQQVSTVLTEVMQLLNASTTMGRAYEIDPTLRPEGRTGALSRTVESFVAYWERWAKTWEFQALLKARPVAGDSELGERWLAAAEPFVWPEHLDPDVIAEIRGMKSRIESKPEVRKHGERQLKLGPGGIRDVEFSVQLLQVVHGRADTSLREPGTLLALEALASNGYVDDQDAGAIADAYRLLRTVEHRLQLAHERRTHTIPDNRERQEWLARSLGYRADGDGTAHEYFLNDLQRVQATVRELHAKLFYRPLLETYATVPATTAGVTLPGEVTAIGEKAAIDRLNAFGFRDGKGALAHVRALTAGMSRKARTVRAVLPAMLQALQDTPDPDTGLGSFRDLVEPQSESGELLTYLRDHVSSVDLLGKVLGTSRVAAELLLRQPQGVDWLRDEKLRDEPRTRDQLVRMAVGRLHWQDTTQALRRFKRLEQLRIVLRDLAGGTTVESVGEELTALGEACLTGALRAELREQAVKRGYDHLDDLPVSIAIVGMGKLGGRELHYVSDLDVLFVHEAAHGADEREATKIALEIALNVMRSLSDITAEGTAFEVDADLRPEGKNGPLSRSLYSYLQYWQRWAEPWEHQALLRARYVAGDRDLGQRLVDEATAFAYPSGADDPVAPMRRMKARLEKERIPRRIDPNQHLKLGPGGLSDVEWTVQLLQQLHGADDVSVRSSSTYGGLRKLHAAGYLGDHDADQLLAGFQFVCELRNRLYLLRQRDVDVWPSSHPKLETLARSLGYGRSGWQDLEQDRLWHSRQVRNVCERIFYGITPADRHY